MDLILTEHADLLRRLRRRNTAVRVEELKQFFDHLVDAIKTLTYTNQRTDIFDLLTIITDDLAAFNTLTLFDHLVLIHHPIFIYIGRTLEMLLTKSTHSQNIPMTKHEEKSFESLSYLISLLCCHRNQPIESFYGSISKEIPSVTGKINIRDESIGESSRKSNPITAKPNVKMIGLPPSAPTSRPIEEKQFDITKIIRLKKFPTQLIPASKQATTNIIYPPIQTNLPSAKYQDIFLTQSFFDKLNHAISELAQHDYPPFHMKYKVIGRLILVCSKVNLVDPLLDSIIKCLRSKFYRQAFTTIESEQWYLNPKQLFFIYRCSRILIEHEFQRQEQIPTSLCQTMIDTTQSIINIIIPRDGDANHLTDPGRELVHHALHYHLEFLNCLTLTSTGRRYFIQSSTVDQMLKILLSDEFHPNDISEWFEFAADVGIITTALMLLYNLAYEKEIFAILKHKNLETIFSKYHSSKNYFIQFAIQTLTKILNEDAIDEENEPMKLKKAYLLHLETVIIRSKEILKSGTFKEMSDDYTGSKKKTAMITGSFLETLIRDVEPLATTELPANKSIYKDVSRRVRVCTKQDTDEVEKLLDPIVKCLESKFYLEVFRTIEIAQQKEIMGAVSNKPNLAEKHLFFMRDCPEFLFRHDHKQYIDIAESLGKKMFEYTDIIFSQHLPSFFRDHDQEPSTTGVRDRRGSKKISTVDDSPRIEAMSYHIKMLTHFTQTRAMRKEFLRTPILNEILRILNVKLVSDKDSFIRDAQLALIGQSLILLYNLISEDDVSSRLKQSDMLNLCWQFGLSTDKIIHFSSQILCAMLNEQISKNIHRPDALSKTAVEYIGRSVYEPQYLYQGIRLDGLLRSLKNISKYESFTDHFTHEKGGIPAISQCVCISAVPGDNAKKIEKIQKTALTIIWTLSHRGSKVNKKFRENHKLIDQLLVLSKNSPEKFKGITERLIWRLGTVKVNDSKSSEKQLDDEQLPSTDDKWDESIPYDLLISVSNNVTDRVLSTKIYNRLVKQGYRVYNEKQSAHRLEVMRKAMDKKKLILVCLSNNYRSSKLCMAEAEYAQKKSCPIIAILLQPQFQIQGWLKFILGERIPIDFSDKNLDKKLLILYDEIEQYISSD